jgi:Na+/H+ antiporter NhaD/arsenite permease-like protein
VWRLACVASVSAAWLPVMRVGRRPYTARRLADRLDSLSDMALAPSWLPDVLRWLVVMAIVTAVSGAVVPARYRRIQLAAPAVLVALVLVVKRASDSSSWTSATPWLILVFAAGVIAVVAALLPVRAREHRS